MSEGTDQPSKRVKHPVLRAVVGSFFLVMAVWTWSNPDWADQVKGFFSVSGL